jgi:hypothetical protein
VNRRTATPRLFSKCSEIHRADISLIELRKALAAQARIGSRLCRGTHDGLPYSEETYFRNIQRVVGR